MSATHSPGAPLRARAAGSAGDAGASNPLDEFGPVRVLDQRGRIAAVAEDAALGLTFSQSAKKRGWTKAVVAGIAWRSGIKFSAGRRGFPPGKPRSLENRENCSKGQMARFDKKRSAAAATADASIKSSAEPVSLHVPDNGATT